MIRCDITQRHHKELEPTVGGLITAARAPPIRLRPCGCAANRSRRLPPSLAVPELTACPGLRKCNPRRTQQSPARVQCCSSRLSKTSPLSQTSSHSPISSKRSASAIPSSLTARLRASPSPKRIRACRRSSFRSPSARMRSAHVRLSVSSMSGSRSVLSEPAEQGVSAVANQQPFADLLQAVCVSNPFQPHGKAARQPLAETDPCLS